MSKITSAAAPKAARHSMTTRTLAGCALRTRREGDAFVSDYVPVRPLPAGDDWFETVWHEYNSIHGIAEEETEHGRNHSPDARGL